MNTLLTFTSSFFLSASAALASSFTGSIFLEQRENTRIERLLYQVSENKAKISQLGKVIPSPPINIFNFENGDLSILYPHNGTWMHIPKEKKARQTAPVGFPELPQVPGMPQMGAINSTSWSQGNVLSTLGAGRIGPSASQIPTPPSGAPAIPAMPSMPQRPSIPTSPSGIMPVPNNMSPAGMPALPQDEGHSMPTMPSFPGMQKAAVFELKSSEETRSIHGYLCTKYKIDLPREGGEVTLWLSDSKDLPPFHTLLHEGSNERELNTDWQQKLPLILREKQLFPFEVTYSQQGEEKVNSTMFHLKLTKIEHTETVPNEVFKIPANFHKLEAHRF